MDVKNGIKILLMGAGIGTGQSATTSIPAIADGWVQSSGVLGLSTGDTDASFSTSRSGGNNVRHGIYEFSLETIPVGAIITGATLQLTTSRFISNTGGTADISVYGFTGDGSVTVADFGTDPNPGDTTSSGSFATGTGAGSTPTGTTLEFDFTELATINAANQSGSDFMGLRTQTVNFVDFRIAALENEDFAPPTLEITYIPESGTALLVALGAIIGIRRRVRK